MSKFFAVQTDAAAVAGWGADTVTGLTTVKFNKAIALIDVKQAAGAVLANDADWALWVERKDTGLWWPAEMLDPANSGGKTTFSMPFKIAPNSRMQWRWSGQGAAQANTLVVEYEEL